MSGPLVFYDPIALAKHAMGERLREEIEKPIREAMKMMDFKGEARRLRELADAVDNAAHSGRMRTGLSLIAEYAELLRPKLNGMEVKVGGVDMGAFFGALRDYAKEVRDGPNTSGRRYNTDGVSAAKRWGIDFEHPPWA